MSIALALACRTPWAMLPESLEQLLAIVGREAEVDLQALEAKLGRPLDNTQAATLRGDTALIPVVGPICRYGNLLTQVSGATSVQVLATDFQAALDNPAVRRIVLDVNSPGGAVDGVQEFAAQVYAARSQKEIVAYVGGTGASGAYWIAAAASRIVVAPTARLGSIGVLATFPRGDAKSIEIVSTLSPKKRPNPESEDGRAQLLAVIDELARLFVADVAAWRGVTPEKVLADFGQGGLLVGAQAVQAGLADQVGSLEELLQTPTQGVRPMSTAPAVPAAPAQSAAQSAATPPVPDLAQVQSQAASATVARLEALEAAFPHHLPFAREQWKAGHDVGQAQAAHYPLLLQENASLRAELAQAQAQAQAAATQVKELQAAAAQAGSQGLPPPSPPPGPAAPDAKAAYEAKVKELLAAGDARPEATIAEKHPALHAAYLQAVN